MPLAPSANLLSDREAVAVVEWTDIMSLGAGVGDKAGTAGHHQDRPSTLSSEFIPYLLSTADAFVILFISITSGIAYQVALGNDIPNVVPHAAVGLLASF